MTSEARNGDNLHCLVGPELFRFESFQQWVNKAASWFATCGYPSRHAICVDAKGRICQYGKHFMTARDEDAFPVRVCMAREDDMPNDEFRGGCKPSSGTSCCAVHSTEKEA